MTLALDTDVLVAWSLSGATRHDAVKSLLESERGSAGATIALTAQVLFEFLHVVTDPRRFEKPLTMSAATARAEALWWAPETLRVAVEEIVPGRVGQLLRQHRLGRKRILDTALAATLEAAGVHRLATFNSADFAVFDFLSVVTPGARA